ncbi:hypothetical protein [Larkinella sp.]|uniref:hypothetical protein n=1 Tax=Larkinella sp. TaxID=2034517 RepID=UPI003BA8E6CE
MMTPEKLEYVERVLQHTRTKHPNMPKHGIPKPKTNFNSSNALTKAVLKTFEIHGLYAVRVQSQGQFDPQLKIFRKGTTRPGVSDVHCLLGGSGRHCSIEIKYGQDKMSPAQRQTAKQVQESGGIYYVAKDFESFWRWFNDQIKKGGSHE